MMLSVVVRGLLEEKATELVDILGGIAKETTDYMFNVHLYDVFVETGRTTVKLTNENGNEYVLHFDEFISVKIV